MKFFPILRVMDVERRLSVHFGNVLEPIVKKEFTRRTGIRVRSKKAILQSEKYPFMLANVDGVIYENGEMCIFEAKTASEYKKEIWEEGVPMEYILQIQHYMAVTGAKKTYIAALVGGNQFYYHKVLRDDNLIEKIIEMEKTFWEDSVIAYKEPIADGSVATAEYLNEKYKKTNGEVVNLPKEALSLCDNYEEILKQIKELTEKKESIANQLKNFLKENEIGIVGNHTVKWKQITTTSFDKKRLAKDNKALYEQYCSQHQQRRFSVA